jgi:hypothetical protein
MGNYYGKYKNFSQWSLGYYGLKKQKPWFDEVCSK